MMFKSKKGSELSMNVIIIAAIAVLILVILAVFIIKATSNVDKATGCTTIGGSCVGGPGTQYTIPYPPGDDECSATRCYISVKSQS